ncbi:MAG: hypothetical protein IK134_13680 [Oscillospiraceae bacterium]|nr:hypothetical protein [Oscillospiraceae bacterium]
MSNSKIRHWVYTAIGILILIGIAWFLLLRESKVTANSLSGVYSAHQKAFENVASYLLDREAAVDITDLPTIDNGFNIPVEQSDAYDAFSDGLYELMETEICEIIAAGDSVRFVTPKSGGILVQNHGELAVGNAPIAVYGAPRDVLTGKWYYYIVKED